MGEGEDLRRRWEGESSFLIRTFSFCGRGEGEERKKKERKKNSKQVSAPKTQFFVYRAVSSTGHWSLVTGHWSAAIKFTTVYGMPKFFKHKSGKG